MSKRKQTIEQKELERESRGKHKRESRAKLSKRKQTIEQKELERESTGIRKRESRAKLTLKQRQEHNKKSKERMRGVRDGSTKRKRQAEIATDDDDLSPFIKEAVRQAKKRLHRTKHPNDSTQHRSYVCIACDCFLLGTEALRTLTREQLKAHKHKLGVHEYEQFHGVKLNKDQISQYHVPTFPNMLLSRRSRKIGRGWVSCGHCASSLRPDTRYKRNPPKFAIANGFAIGEFPDEIERMNPRSRRDTKRKVNVENVTDEMRAVISPARAFGHIFAYSGGSHKSIQGHYQFFETDQSQVGGVIEHVRDMGVAHNMYIMLCGRMTPAQRTIIRRRAHLDTEEYMDLLNFFIKVSGHSGYSGLPMPENFPRPLFVEDKETENNVDREVNKGVEKSFQGGTYYFSTAQDPSDKTSVFGDSRSFAMALLNQSAPTLLTIGGNYANMRELRVEDVLPFAFPYGMGGPIGKRRTPISQEACFQRYFRLAMPQFMRGDVILVLGHMYGRILTFRSGVMICRSQINGVPLGETLSKFTIKDFSSTSSTNPAMETLLKAVTTSCRALGHTPEAAKFARKCYFALMDHFGLNSLFLSITPCDLCSFRVRLYVRAEEFVSSIHLIINFYNLQNYIAHTCTSYWQKSWNVPYPAFLTCS